MNIIGHGIDIVEVSRIKKLIKRSGEHFERRCFTAAERNAIGTDANRIQYLAGRFAAKEAVLKALGTGWSQGTSLLDIEIQRLPTGQPSVVLYAKCKEIASELGVTRWLLSISHTSSHATASAIAVGSTSPEQLTS
ncbi:MAG TPA: holo-[acyl-carrier-protein] synthase [Cyanobacteria bacterium UBA8543]|nr:holo-[acyl-carrier-protein] synthase [Cyanobacteria bacterium UBA8543]